MNQPEFRPPVFSVEDPGILGMTDHEDLEYSARRELAVVQCASQMLGVLLGVTPTLVIHLIVAGPNSNWSHRIGGWLVDGLHLPPEHDFDPIAVACAVPTIVVAAFIPVALDRAEASSIADRALRAATERTVAVVSIVGSAICWAVATVTGFLSLDAGLQSGTAILAAVLCAAMAPLARIETRELKKALRQTIGRQQRILRAREDTRARILTLPKCRYHLRCCCAQRLRSARERSIESGLLPGPRGAFAAFPKREFTLASALYILALLAATPFSNGSSHLGTMAAGLIVCVALFAFHFTFAVLSTTMAVGDRTEFGRVTLSAYLVGTSALLAVVYLWAGAAMVYGWLIALLLAAPLPCFQVAQSIHVRRRPNLGVLRQINSRYHALLRTEKGLRRRIRAATSLN